MRTVVLLQVTAATERAVKENRIGALVDVAQGRVTLILCQRACAGQQEGSGHECPFRGQHLDRHQLSHSGRSLPRTVSNGFCHWPGVFDSCTMGARR